MKEIEFQIVSLRKLQHAIVDMLKALASDSYGSVVDKKMRTRMLAASGMNENAVMR